MKVVQMFQQMCVFLLLVFVLTEHAVAQSTTIYAAAHGGPAALGSTLYALDATTGHATPVINAGKNLGALAFAPSGVLYGVEMVGVRPFLMIYDPVHQTSTGIGSLETGDRPNDIAFRPSDGALYAYIHSTLYTVDTTNGLATFVGGSAPPLAYAGLAFWGNTLYAAVTSIVGGQTWLREVNQTTGSTTDIVPLTYEASIAANNPRVTGMKFHPVTGVLYAVIATGKEPDSINEEPEMGYLAVINITTGLVTVLGPSVAGIDAIAVAGSARATTIAIPLRLRVAK